MRGCLSLPFRLALLALLVLGGFLAWSSRDAIRRRIHSWTAEPAGVRDSVAWGDPARAPAARRKLAALERGRADSVLLGPGELADLLAAVARERLAGAVDSVQVRADRDELAVRARVDTRKIPLSFGPLSGVIHDWETVELGGRALFRHGGLAEWEVTRARVRGIPLPRDVLARLLGAFGADPSGVVPIPLPASVGGLRISATGLMLYGSAARGRVP